MDIVSFTLHNVVISNDEDLPQVVSTIRTFNSASRCAVKHFNSIGLSGMIKGYTPIERKGTGHFSDYLYAESPVGMSDAMWRNLRRQSYDRKRSIGLARANRFFQMDKDLGYPIAGTRRIVGKWVKDNEFNLDSTLLHDAVMNGFKTYMSFSKKQDKYDTSRNSPVFGDMVNRSQKRISRNEFQLSKNSSITVVGKAKVGNPKFRFDLEKNELYFILNRKRIAFNYSHNRFSKNGYDRFYDIIGALENHCMPVTVTLTRLGGNRFNVTLTYASSELSSFRKERKSHRNDVVCALYATDEVLCHRIVNTKTHKVLHSEIHDIGSICGEKNARNTIERLKWDGKHGEIRKVEKRIRNRKSSSVNLLIKRIFNINRSYQVGDVVVESASSRNNRNFNRGLIEFSKEKIKSLHSDNCFISAKKFCTMVKGHCARNGMRFNKVNGAFIQLKAVMKAETMCGAVHDACNQLVERHISNGVNLELTDWRKFISNSSMLDWVGHLLHNKRSRQAGFELRKLMKTRMVEKAIRLLDGRSRCSGTDEARHCYWFG